MTQIMHNKKRLLIGISSLAMFTAIVASFFAFQSPGTHAAAGSLGTQSVRQISSAGTTQFQASTPGAPKLQQPEIDKAAQGMTQASVRPNAGYNRSYSHTSSNGATATSTTSTVAGSELTQSFNGLDFFQQRFANGGNQFSVEPPDQGLCVGNGLVMESVNDVLNVYNENGKSLLGVVDLNTFYHYPDQINRTTGKQGPFVTDPSCYFDKPTQRWFQIALTLDVNPSTGAFLGSNHLDIAVSKTSSPLGKWTIYRLPVQDDGTMGTPNHGCAGGPCLGDYPHLGADANAFFITTNEYPFFAATGFHAAQIYAFSKQQLAASASFVKFVQFDTINTVNHGLNPAFTVWPAISPDHQYDASNGGTEYFLSSDAAVEANGTGGSTDLITWAVTNTSSLNTSAPALSLNNTISKVKQYVVPPKSNQKPGSHPLGECLNIPSCSTLVLGAPDPFHEVLSHLDSNDTRMQQVTYANGLLWGSLDTSLTVSGNNQAGIEWFVVKPSASSSSVAATLVNNGYLGLAKNNLTYPAIGVTTSGQGVMAFTVVGANYYPSAGYALINASGVSSVHIAAAGLGPDDGFTSYVGFVGNPPRTRWGDFGGAVADGNSIWIASEYIGQTCTLQQYLTNTASSPLFTCGLTRGALGNWYTRISRVAFTS